MTRSTVFPSHAFPGGRSVRMATSASLDRSQAPEVILDGLEVLFDDVVKLMPLPPRQSPEAAQAQSQYRPSRTRARRGRG